MLSRGFVQVERHQAAVYKRVKSMLPRRESERRMHRLARSCDVLSAIETRISMLNMTFMKYIENNLCCFIPGKVLDEIERLLSLVENSRGPIPRTHELLQEMRDISSMAMEHFEENIMPSLRAQLESSTVCSFAQGVPKSSRVYIVQNSISDDMKKMRKQSKSNKQNIGAMMQYVQKLHKKMKSQRIRIRMLTVRVRDQERKIQEQNAKLQNQESTVAELKRHMDEWEQKFLDLTGEMTRAREDLSSKSAPSTSDVSSSFYKPTIRPRMAQIRPSLHYELDRKRKLDIVTPEVPVKLPRSSRDEEEETSSASGLGSNLGSFLTNSLETILNTPISGIRPRKRKMTQELDLK